MGYDPIQFLSQVDDEFLCSICTLVIENPVQTICEHLFCNECILNWLDVTEACPVDGRPLTTKDLSDPNRVLRNMLNKLEIKCDFGKLMAFMLPTGLVGQLITFITFRTTWMPNYYQVRKLGTTCEKV